MACSIALFRRVDTDRYMSYSSELHSILFTTCNGKFTNWELCALCRSGFGRRRKRDAFPFVFQTWHHSCLMHSCCPFPLFTLYVGWGGGSSALDNLSFTILTLLVKCSLTCPRIHSTNLFAGRSSFCQFLALTALAELIWSTNSSRNAFVGRSPWGQTAMFGDGVFN